MADISLRVNGSERKVSVSPDTPLLWVLRDTLNLTGTKFGCGAGSCRGSSGAVVFYTGFPGCRQTCDDH